MLEVPLAYVRERDHLLRLLFPHRDELLELEAAERGADLRDLEIGSFGEVFIGECLGVRAELYEDLHLVRMEALAERRKIGHRRAWRDGAVGFAFAAARMRAIVLL